MGELNSERDGQGSQAEAAGLSKGDGVTPESSPMAAMSHRGLSGVRNSLRQSQLLTRATKDVDRDQQSLNAQLLTRAGFVRQLTAGVYSFLPLGNRVLSKIEAIVHDEMAKVGGQEITLPVLHPKENWETTGRWDSMDILFKVAGQGGREFALGPTHEEIVTPTIGAFIKSYRDLPVKTYQIQDKFRNEVRTKSGLLRGRQFRMKDLYSFHADQADLDRYYEQVTEAYHRVFERCGLGDKTVYTYATGGEFSKYSHEFQTLTEFGEDVIYRVPGTDNWFNKELLADAEALKDIGVPDRMPIEELESAKSIEVGNIFKLGSRFSEPFGITYVDQEGKAQPVVMGCYGIGTTRLMGAVVECSHDDAGIIWPQEIAPFQLHLVSLSKGEDQTEQSDRVFDMLSRAGIEVLYDDRPKLQPGRKFAESDLLGIPNRVVLGRAFFDSGQIELKDRSALSPEMLSLEELVRRFTQIG